MDNKERKKKRIAVIVAAVLLLAAAIIIFLYFRSQIRATTMRILRIEGQVSLEDSGKSKEVTENLRLNSGNALSTAVKSLVSIGLDEEKIVTLVENSRAIFNQAGRQLDLELTDGSLFFEVQKPLEDDETMDVRTSTMIVGIRGTSGWVSVEGDHESVIISDGHVHIIGKNPTTGETKEIEVYAGQKVSTYLYNDRSVDSIMFFVEDVTEHDLPEAMLECLREDDELLDKVVTETGWDKPWILGMEEQSLTTTPETSPEPEEVPDKDKDSDSEDDLTPTPTLTPSPTPTKSAKQLEQEELEKLLAEMLANMTPTPTPTPTLTWVAQTTPEPEPEPEEDDDHEESTPTPTPTPTAAPTQPAVPKNYSNVANNAIKGPISMVDSNYYTSPSGGQYKLGNPGIIEVTSGDVTFEFPMTVNATQGGNSNTIGLDFGMSLNSIWMTPGATFNGYRRVGGNTDIVYTDEGSGNSYYHYGTDTAKYSVFENPTVNAHQGWWRLAGGTSGDVYIQDSDGKVQYTQP